MVAKKNVAINGKEYFRIRRKIDGKMKCFYGSSKSDAEDQYKEYIKDLARMKYEHQVSVDTARFSERAEDYIENSLRVSPKYATGTKKKYEEAYRCHIKGTDLDRMRIKDIDANVIQRFYDSLPVSKQTMQNINKFMVGFSRWLQINRFANDFMSAVEIPQKPDNKKTDEIVIWSDDDVVRIRDASVSACDSFRAWFLPLVLIYTGVRISEALGLKYSDFEDGYLTIERQYNLGEIKPPKYGSRRKIPVHEELQKALAMHREIHQKEMKKNNYKTDYIFTTASGHLYDAHNIRRALQRFYDRNGIQYRHPHAYRSTFCSKLCENDVPIEVAATLMGHKSISVTAKFYARISDQKKEDAISSLNYGG